MFKKRRHFQTLVGIRKRLKKKLKNLLNLVYPPSQNLLRTLWNWLCPSLILPLYSLYPYYPKIFWFTDFLKITITHLGILCCFQKLIWKLELWSFRNCKPKSKFVINVGHFLGTLDYKFYIFFLRQYYSLKLKKIFPKVFFRSKRI